MGQFIDFESYRREWLAPVEMGSPTTLDLGRRFSQKIVTQWRELSDDSDDDVVYCDGTGDGGIDIAILEHGDPEDDDSSAGDTWFLVQSKYGSAFAGTETLLREAQKVIDTLDGQRAGRLSSLAEGLLERLGQFRRQASERDRIVLVFATEGPLNEEQQRVLGDVRAVGRARLGALFDVEHVSIDTIYRRMLDDLEAQRTRRTKVGLRADMVSFGSDLMVGTATISDLYSFLQAYRVETGDLDRIYEKNVRRFLGSRTRVNKAMIATLKEQPERFGLYNNGITIVVADFAMSDGVATLFEPYVVNGCQTTRSLWEVCHQRLEAGGTGVDPKLEDWKKRAEQGAVVTKIVRVGAAGEALLQAITRYTNSQNAVREKDFLALTSDFRTWANVMSSTYGIFLETQRGAWESQRVFQKQHPDSPQFKEAAHAFDLIKIYGAGWLGEIGQAFGRNAAFLPNGAAFKRIMEGMEGDPFGVEDLYAAYLLSRAADGYKFGRSAEKPTRRQTKYLFYWSAVELLRDVLIRTTRPTTKKDISRAFIAVASKTDAAQALFDAAVDVVDEYMTQGEENSVHKEPSFINSFNNDIHSFLKWEKLGKSDDSTPLLRQLIAEHKRTLGRGAKGIKAPRELIGEALQASA